MKDKEVKILGTLKKEKSSKPFFVLFVFILIIGFCYSMPYVKAKFGDDYTLDDLINKTTTTTEPTTTIPVENEIITSTLTCTISDISEYTYTFNDNKLVSLEHKYTYNKVDDESYKSYLNIFDTRKNSVLALNGKSSITESDTGFIYDTIIDNENDFTSIDLNYYKIGTLYDTIRSEMSNRGVCK